MGRIQFILITLVWLLILTVPILFGEFKNGINWIHILKIWKEYSVVFVIFLINHFVLLPFLFFKGKGENVSPKYRTEWASPVLRGAKLFILSLYHCAIKLQWLCQWFIV